MKKFTVDHLNQEHFSQIIPNAVILILYIVIGFLGNTAVLFVYTKDMKNVFSSGRLFIPFLALSDLVTLLFNGFVEFQTELQTFKATTDGLVFCKFKMFIGIVLVIISGCLYLAIAVHRYLLICRPHLTFPSRSQKLFILIVSGLFVFGISVPKFIFSGFAKVIITSKKTSNQTVGAYLCGNDERFENTLGSNIYNVLLIVNSCIWNFILAILYIYVGKQIYKRGNHIKSNTYVKDDRIYTSTGTRSIEIVENQGPKPMLVKQITMRSIKTFIINNRLSWMFIIMTLLNIICYTPKLVLDVQHSMDRYFFLNKDDSTFLILSIADNLYLLNNAINPFLYGFFDREFKNRFTKRLCFKCK